MLYFRLIFLLCFIGNIIKALSPTRIFTPCLVRLRYKLRYVNKHLYITLRDSIIKRKLQSPHLSQNHKEDPLQRMIVMFSSIAALRRFQCLAASMFTRFELSVFGNA